MRQYKRSQSGFAHVGLLILVLVVLVVVGAVGYRVFSKKGGLSLKTITGSYNEVDGWQTDCDNNNRVNMTHLPMNMDDVSSVTPVGLTAGAHVTPIDHLYFYPKEGPRDKYPVYAMADGYITGIGTRGVNVSTGEKRPTEYRIVMQHSCQTLSYFDLVTKLDQSIIDKFPDAATKGMSGRFPIKAGQEIGRIGAQSLDTAIYNKDLILKGFIHPSMYKAEPWKVHTDQFFTYFSEPLRSQMLAKNARKVEPVSGKIDYDQPGKLIGNWFKVGNNGYAGPTGFNGVGSNNQGPWTGHLAIFYDAYDPSIIDISIGDFKNHQPQAFNVTGNKPDPATISKASGIVKYELVQQSNAGIGPGGMTQQNSGPQPVAGTVLFQVLAGEKLKVEYFVDKPASQATGFTSAAIMYER